MTHHPEDQAQFDGICAVIPNIVGRAGAEQQIWSLIAEYPDMDLVDRARECRDYWDREDAKSKRPKNANWPLRFINNIKYAKNLRMKNGRYVNVAQYRSQRRFATVTPLRLVLPTSGSQRWDDVRDILRDEDEQRAFAYKEQGIASTFDRIYKGLIVVADTDTTLILETGDPFVQRTIQGDLAYQFKQAFAAAGYGECEVRVVLRQVEAVG